MADAERCVFCGAVVPEGRQVCYECMMVRVRKATHRKLRLLPVKKQSWVSRIVRKVLMKLGILKQESVSVEEMCKRGQAVCSHDCQNCIWGRAMSQHGVD